MAARGGLEDVVACTSEICAIDGQRGLLTYRGYDVRELAGRVPFEDVCYLLWSGTLPGREEAGDLRGRLREALRLPPGFADWLRALPRGSAMAALRTAVSALGMQDPQAGGPAAAEGGLRPGAAADLRDRAVRLTGQVAAVTCAWARLGRGLAPLPPRPDLGHAANFLYMLTGAAPTARQERAMDVALVLHADHELNASTFAARVTAATLADMHAAVTAAVATLEGPLHGGANESVTHVIDEIGQPEQAEGWVRRALGAGRKIPGFGHRVYRTVDPRAVVLRQLARELAEEAGDLRPYHVTVALQEAVERIRGLYPNVDLYSGVVYRLLGIPVGLFTATFAVSRVSGWTAHIIEQYEHNRLIRPRAQYVGPPPRGLAGAAG